MVPVFHDWWGDDRGHHQLHLHIRAMQTRDCSVGSNSCGYCYLLGSEGIRQLYVLRWWSVSTPNV